MSYFYVTVKKSKFPLEKPLAVCHMYFWVLTTMEYHLRDPTTLVGFNSAKMYIRLKNIKCYSIWMHILLVPRSNSSGLTNCWRWKDLRITFINSYISHLYPLIHSWQPLHRPTEPFFWGIQTFQRWSVQPWDHPNLSIEHVQHGWYFKFDASRYHVGSLLQGMMNQLLRIHLFVSLSMGILHCQVSFVEYTYIIIWYVYETYLYIYIEYNQLMSFVA